MRNATGMGARRNSLRGNIFRTTVLAAALLGVYGAVSAQTITVDSTNSTVAAPYGLDPALTYTNVIVNAAGFATGADSKIIGNQYELTKVNAGGSLTLTGANILNDVSTPTGTNGRAVTASGAGATASLTGSTIELKAFSTNPGTNYNHAFTAAVGAENGGHVDVSGGSIKASGSKRTVGIAANDGGSITASNLTIDTYSSFGHAVNAYRTLALGLSPTVINLDHVTINTHDLTYSVGIQSANLGASVNANATDINTVGAGSFGVEVFNGATVSLTNGSITTTGAYAAGVRAYTGTGAKGLLGAGTATVNGTKIVTSGLGASGALAGDSGEPTKGVINLTQANISTTGDGASGLSANYGSAISSTGSTIRTQGVNSHGASATGSSTLNLTNTTIGVSGTGANGVDVESGSSATINGGSISSIGNDWGTGLYVFGTGSTLTATDLAITTQRTRVSNAIKPIGVGVEAYQGGSVTLTRGSVSTAQDWNDGLLALEGTVQTSGTAIQTNGLASTGVKAWHGIPGSSLTSGAILTGGSVTTLGNESYGLLAQNLGSTVTASNLSVTTQGSQSFGVDTYNGGVVNLSNVNVTTNGANAHGLVVGSMSPTMRPGSVPNPTVASTIAMTGGSVVAKGSNASGAYLEDSGSLTLNGVNVQSTGASITSQLTQAGQTQNITVGSGTTMTQNNGTLLQVNRAAAGMDGIVNLTLAAGSTSTGDVVDLDGLTVGGSGTRTLGGKTNFTVATGASWTGVVKGINDTTAADNSSFVDNGGAPIAGNVSGGSNASIVFTNGATIGGGVSTGAGSQGSFSGTTTIGGNVSGSDSTLTFNGPTTIGQGLSTQGSAVTFGNTTTITQSVNSGTGSTVTFNGAATIGQNLTGGSGSNVTFAGPTTISQNVSGNGTNFQFSKGHSTTIGGNVVLSNSSVLRGGTTATPITITGNTDVTSGAILGGNLFVSGSLSGSGGVLSPGNSVGTQSYATSGAFSGDFDMEVNAAGKSDLIIIRSGNLDLSGKNLIVGQEIVNGVANGGYVLNHDYTIVQTPSGNVVNTFDSQKLNSSFADTLVTLDPVKYGSQDVKVSLSIDSGKVANKRIGLSANQNATLDGVISVAGQNTSAGAALVSTDTQGVLNQLSGEVHGSTQSALLSSGGQLVRTLSNRMRANLGSPMMAGAPVAQASGPMPAGAMPQSSAYPLWAQVVGDWQTFKGNDNTAKSSLATGGLFVGGDTSVGAGWRVGGAVGFTNGRVDVNDRSSKSDLKSYSASLYGGKSWATEKGQINFLAGAGYTRYSVDSRRSVTVGGAQTLEANYHANATQLFTELGYAIPVGQASTIEPYVGLAWINLRSQGFDETGGAAALHGDSRTDSVSTMTLGLRGKTTVNVGRQTATLTAGLGWRLAGGDVNPERRLAFIQGNGAAFNVAGAPIARNSAVVDLGAEMAVGKNAALGLAYSGQFGAGNRDNTGSLYVKVRF